MENFVLYEEVGRGKNSIIYKGRRKGTINFVAIHCIDKVKRPHITNLVRLTHEIQHTNVVKFHEWYETSNHLWLVVELCTGGSLEMVISQDDHLPESSIRSFGTDMVQGLHHIHSLGIIFSDIKPSKVLLDGPGILKFAGFGLSRLEGENLDELFEQFADTGETWTSNQDAPAAASNDDIPKKYRNMGYPTYMAPDILAAGGNHTIASDLWSLGCLLYEMYTGKDIAIVHPLPLVGHPPFLAENFKDLKEKIMNKEIPPPKLKGSRVSGKCSPEFQSLLEGLLKKDPHERLDWSGLVTHSFWQGSVQHLAKDLETSCETQQSMRQSLRQSIASFRASLADLPKTNSRLGNIREVDLPPDSRRSVDRTSKIALGLDATDGDAAMNDLFRPKSAAGGGEGTVAFTLSSRPCTAATPAADEHLTSPQKLMTQSPLDVKETIRRAKQEMNRDDEKNSTNDLIYHTSDFTVTPIVDNPKIQKPPALKFDSKILLVPPYSGEKIMSLTPKEQEKHITSLVECICQQEKGPPSQKRMHLFNYTASVAGHSNIANMMVRAGALQALAKHVKDAPSPDLKARLGRVLALIANNANEVEENISLSEVFSTLIEVLRDGFRNTKVKVAVLPALGEMLYLVSTLEEVKGRSVDSWAVSSMTYTLIIRCLREGEDAIVNHYATKIIENVSTTTGSHSQKFAVNEVGLLLWYVFTHATADAVRITALSALSRLAKHSVGVFQSVVEKVGLPKMLSTMALPITRIQQAMVTMFASLITSDARLTRLIQDKEFSAHVMRLLESPSVVIRGKAFLVILEVIKNNQEMLLICCQNRLVMYIERDSRKQAPGKAENTQQIEYLGKCLEWLVSTIIDLVPAICKEILTGLDAVSGRKHPSTIQVKQLKMCLPLTPILQHLTTSQTFRPRIVDELFMKNIASFLVHVRSIDSGTTQIQGATGPSGTEEFIHTVFGVVEAIAQHPSFLLEFHSLVIDKILASLALLVSSSAGDTRALSLRLFSEIASIFLDCAQFDAQQHKAEAQKLHNIIADALLPQYEQILLEQDPLPSYGLKLLVALLEQNSVFIKQFEKLGLTPVLFQVLVDHQSNPISTTMQQIASILNVLACHKETNIRDLYEQGLVDHLMTMFIEVAAICMNSDNTELKAPSSMLMSLLDTLNYLLKYVSEVVRKALQAKKGGGDQGGKEAEQAEQLLLTNKAFTDLMSLLTQLLCFEHQETTPRKAQDLKSTKSHPYPSDIFTKSLVHEDTDISDMALKCLSLLVQLFGGENPDAMSPENMDCYSEALKHSDAKKQKIILRILKRMISTEKVHADSMRQHGASLAETIRGLVPTASSHAEVALTTLAGEILKGTGYM